MRVGKRVFVVLRYEVLGLVEELGWRQEGLGHRRIYLGLIVGLHRQIENIILV